MRKRIVFIGASSLGLRCLEEMVSLSCCEVVGAVTAPEVFAISYRPQGVTNVLYADVKEFCDARDISCSIMTQGMNDLELLKQVQVLSPDIFVVSGWYHMIPESWLKIAPTYGLHASLLPDYSGGAPLVWAMINGEIKTGITLFKFADGVDNGPIVGQMPADIYSEDTISTLCERIELLGIKLLQEYLPHLADSSAKLIAQNESQRRVFPQRSPEDGVIDWSLPAQQIYNFIRAQTKPYPGAFSSHGKDKISIWASRIADDVITPRLILAEIKVMEQRVFVGCGDGSALEIIDLAVNGTDISAYDWWCGQTEPDRGHGFS
jgi:methionyl-tRNA formyltransferase